VDAATADSASAPTQTTLDSRLRGNDTLVVPAQAGTQRRSLLAVTVTQAELGGQKFQGKVARTAASIDAATRTMQVEIALPNRDGALLPGAYVQVGLPLEASQGMLISANTLMIRGDGIRVATVDPKGRVKLAPVKIGRNLGDSVEVLEGVGTADRLVLNPSDSLADGDQVAIAPSR
jgi:multidrug efflux pump subunit AcrA (membrane-fusion protein)